MDYFRIAIADDNARQLDEFCNLVESDPELKLTGTAVDGDTACELIRREQPDLVILDIVMPFRDGLSVMDEILHDPNIYLAPTFLVVTAVGSEHVIQQAFGHGAAYVLRKPVDREVLLGRVHQLLSKKVSYGSGPAPLLVREENAFFASGDMDTDVCMLLHALGIPPHIRGYHYLRDAVRICMENPKALDSITRNLYPPIASSCQTSPARVERAIRHAIDLAWSKGKLKMLDRIFGYAPQLRAQKPTNSEFIALLFDKISLEYKNRLSKE